MKQGLKIQETVYELAEEAKTNGTEVAALTITTIDKQILASVIGTTPNIAQSLATAIQDYPAIREILVLALVIDSEYDTPCNCPNCKANRAAKSN